MDQEAWFNGNSVIDVGRSSARRLLGKLRAIVPLPSIYVKQNMSFSLSH